MGQFEFMLTHAPASLVILITTVGVSLIGFRSGTLTERFLLFPWKVYRGNEHVRIISYGFLHADFMHLAFNLIALYSVAMYVEAVAGTARFLAIYFGSMVGAALPPVFLKRNNPDYRALGASGAVSGLFFAGMMYFPTAKVMLLFLPIPLPWPVFAVLFIAGSVLGARKNWGNIGHDVHLYGALSGLLLTIALDPSSIGTFLEGVGLG
ncbi:MAG: rhomboid family intramembrane serine protease [Bacteroidota bacterium]|nr:rhomboid family intramembrane serine protease [Bacteroidota bacterium]